jgi:hypothetical protein
MKDTTDKHMSLMTTTGAGAGLTIHLLQDKLKIFMKRELSGTTWGSRKDIVNHLLP